ncbi:MAG: hypothetical protein SFX73_36190 [Kofleriaceae bacterium]|nr:hypothetical protein [Kofleriaceae bacterium]
MYATLRGDQGYIVETVGFHVDRTEALRANAIAAIPGLLAAAWEIRDGGWDLVTANARLVGRELVAER